MSEPVRVCNADDLSEGERTVIEHRGREIGVFNVDGEYYAILNHCLHQGGPLCEGRVRNQLVGEFAEPGQRVEERFTDELEIACPWHGWVYDLETGEHLGDSSIVVPTFDVFEEQGDLYLEV